MYFLGTSQNRARAIFQCSRYSLGRMTAEKCNSSAEKFRNEGNVHFRGGNFLDALIALNKSVCFAESPQSLSAAFADRSAVYLQVKMFEKCLENIELSRSHGKIDKLKDREEKCRELMTNSFDDPYKFFQLTYPANDKIPFIVNCLELRESHKFGRYVVSNKNLRIGDVICIEEPFYKFIDKEFCYRRCANCLSSNSFSLISCSTCVSCK